MGVDSLTGCMYMCNSDESDYRPVDIYYERCDVGSSVQLFAELGSSKSCVRY